MAKKSTKMTKIGWKRLIIQKMTEAGTYDEVFDPVIDTLADILIERDRVYEQYIKEGSSPLVRVVSDRGQENMRKNPLLTTWQELIKDALAYWRDLGLTPAGLKKINEDAMKATEVSALDKILSNLES